jgi:SAM-dependent methyltransferase
MRRQEMMTSDPTTYERFQARYEEGRVPWDDPLPPPEILELAAVLSPGRALDLGCGYGRVAIHLAGRGWTVDSVDFIPQAIAIARQRAMRAGVSERATFHVASAAELPFLHPPYDLAIDIGCMHSFTEEMLIGYRAELIRLLSPGGLYVLFAHLRDEGEPEGDGPRGIPEATIDQLMAAYFVLERVTYGVTQVEDKPPWNSGWFWFRRR